MRTITTTLLTALLGLGLGLSVSLAPSEASAMVFCAKKKKPSKVKVRGEACRSSETEVSPPANPEVRAELDALESGLRSLLAQDHIYVASETVGPFTLAGRRVLCDEGDVATAGGVTSRGHSSEGPFVGSSGPVLDDGGTPIGWRFGIFDNRRDPQELEIHVMCADVNGASSSGTTIAPPFPWTTTKPAGSLE